MIRQNVNQRENQGYQHKKSLLQLKLGVKINILFNTIINFFQKSDQIFTLKKFARFLKLISVDTQISADIDVAM